MFSKLQAVIFLACLSSSFAFAQTDADSESSAPQQVTVSDPKFELEKVLMCAKNVDPKTFAAMVEKLGGIPVIKSSPGNIDTEYTIPNPLNIFGRPVQHVSVHQNTNEDGEFVEYGSFFTGESLETVAKYAGVYLDKDGKYIEHVGGNDLVFRSEMGATYASCNQGVRTLTKRVKKAFKSNQ